MSKLLILIVIGLSFKVQAKTIKVYSWWDYISSDVIQELKKNNFEIDLTVYTSNNQAISRLYNDKRMDFSIVSVLVVDVLKKYSVFNQKLLSQVTNSRTYISNLNKHKFCIPYLWGPTVFFHDKKEMLNEVLDTSKLMELLKSGVTLEVVDDPAEFYGLVNNNSNCKRNKKNCIKEIYNTFDGFLRSSSFKMNIEYKVKKKPYVYYGWLGSGHSYNKKNKDKLFIQLPRKVVISQDYLCLSSYSKLDPEMAIKFAKILTNPKNTALNVKSHGYFSPYQGDTSLLDDNLKRVKEETERKIKNGDYVFIPAINDVLYRDVNKLWSKIRYEKQ